MPSPPLASVETTLTDDTMHVVPAGEIDLDTVHVLRTALLEVEAGPSRRVVVDLHHVEFMDSSGLHAIGRTHRSLRARGGTMILRRPQPQVLRAIRLLRLDERIAIVSSPEPTGPRPLPRQVRTAG